MVLETRSRLLRQEGGLSECSVGRVAAGDDGAALVRSEARVLVIVLCLVYGCVCVVLSCLLCYNYVCVSFMVVRLCVGIVVFVCLVFVFFFHGLMAAEATMSTNA